MSDYLIYGNSYLAQRQREILQILVRKFSGMRKQKEIILESIDSLGVTFQLLKPDPKNAFLLEAGVGQGVGAWHLHCALETV